MKFGGYNNLVNYNGILGEVIGDNCWMKLINGWIINGSNLDLNYLVKLIRRVSS